MVFHTSVVGGTLTFTPLVLGLSPSLVGFLCDTPPPSRPYTYVVKTEGRGTSGRTNTLTRSGVLSEEVGRGCTP